MYVLYNVIKKQDLNRTAARINLAKDLKETLKVGCEVDRVEPQ